GQVDRERRSRSARVTEASRTMTPSIIPTVSIQRLLHALARLVIECPDGHTGFLVVECDDYYVQFAARRDEPTLCCEAVSNNYLGYPGDRRGRLTRRQTARRSWIVRKGLTKEALCLARWSQRFDQALPYASFI